MIFLKHSKQAQETFMDAKKMQRWHEVHLMHVYRTYDRLELKLFSKCYILVFDRAGPKMISKNPEKHHLHSWS